MSGIWTKLRDGTLAVGDAARTAAAVDTYRVAVTGLSRAGKTAMMVSLISNLMALARGTAEGRVDSLPALTRLLTDQEGRLRLTQVEIEPSGAQRIPRFEYEAFRHQLASGTAPSWPPVTDRPALITLRLTLAGTSTMRRLTSKMFGEREVRLELLDYPGEWLADLPLLEQSYEQWSAAVLADMRRPPRLDYAREFLAFLAERDLDEPVSETQALQGHRLYREALRQCREERGLRWLQPGRFLMPGPWGDVPLLHFFPWDAVAAPRRGTLAAQLRDRFEAYKAEVRQSFFEPYFSEFNRQIVLVDVLSALQAGRAAFEDVQRALREIGASYARLLEGRFFGRKIETVAFAATKSDHVDDLQRNHLKAQLEHMVGGGGRARRSFHVLSAIRCTEDGTITEADGRTRRIIRAVPLGADTARPLSPGVVPAGEIPPEFWQDDYFVMPVLRPPALRDGNAYPIASLGLDELLVGLLGDVL